jgi:hypothetical protein
MWALYAEHEQSLVVAQATKARCESIIHSTASFDAWINENRAIDVIGERLSHGVQKQLFLRKVIAFNRFQKARHDNVAAQCIVPREKNGYDFLDAPWQFFTHR